MVKTVESPLEAYALIDSQRTQGSRVGLVPTMGALHEGHLSLVQRSRDECDYTVATIFVNPTQFGPHEDYSRYPRTLDSDLGALRDLGADLVFIPTREQLYPSGFSTYVAPPKIAETLEGACRPGHFRGVTTIVMKLFQILPATIAYFGMKDYQQLAVIRQMVEDLNVPIRVQGCETVREKDGLALSSRNRYLSEPERANALSLWKALQSAAQLVAERVYEVDRLEKRMEEVLYDQGAQSVEYARVVDERNLETLTRINGRAVALIAAQVGKTRLIDNLILQTPDAE